MPLTIQDSILTVLMASILMPLAVVPLSKIVEMILSLIMVFVQEMESLLVLQAQALLLYRQGNLKN